MGWFDPPYLKAQKKASKQATSLRRQAARDAAIEVQMLVNRHHLADAKRMEAYRAGNMDLAGRLADALANAQECLDRAGRLAEGIPMELAETHSSPSTGKDHEALATFELEARGYLLALRTEAKEHLQLLGGLSFEAIEIGGRHQ